jgi:SAM-dependent methyltransferase
MNSPVTDHYDRLLGPVYSWMIGELESADARADAELTAVGLPRATRGYAIDLGAGFGLHAVPLARRGYRVLALDSCEALLQELKARAGALPIETCSADLLRFCEHTQSVADVILCMGDTLTHLPDVASVEALLTAVATSLRPGGVFVATFRDYASSALQGNERFILVRQDHERLLTCFLEYAPGFVRVHDLLHERTAQGWELKVSSYPKLRLAAPRVIHSLEALGFVVRREAGSGGMARLVAQR